MLDVQSPGEDGQIYFDVAVLPTLVPGSAEISAPGSGTADLEVTITLSAPMAIDAMVDWTTHVVPGSLTLLGLPQAPTSDYTPSSGTVVFEPHQTTATIHIPVNADSASGAEFVVISFSNP